MLPVPLALLCFGFLGVGARNLNLIQTGLRSSAALQVAATPPTPSRQLTLADWQAAAGKFMKIPSRRAGVQETLFSKPDAPGAEAHKCGTPCVAHCIAGQPRDMIRVKGLWKSIKHRLFEQFSDSPVVFALFAMGAEKNGPSAQAEGTEGYVRQQQEDVPDEEVRPSLEFLGVSRALLLREACTTGLCLQKGLRLNCDAKDLNVTELFDKKSGRYTNLCEIQASRFSDSMEMVRGYEADHNMKFDWVTRPRPDVYFTRPTPRALMLDTGSVHVSPWAACGYGGMDWFYATPRKFADTLASFSSGISCSDYKTDPKIAAACNKCPGCECWMAAWMYKEKVPFQRLPWGWFTPSKFCGADCPADWDVTPDTIMGLDARVKDEPCHRGADGLKCPFLLMVDSRVRNSSLHHTI